MSASLDCPDQQLTAPQSASEQKLNIFLHEPGLAILYSPPGAGGGLGENFGGLFSIPHRSLGFLDIWCYLYIIYDIPLLTYPSSRLIKGFISEEILFINKKVVDL